jgi:hypothetical protein
MTYYYGETYEKTEEYSTLIRRLRSVREKFGYTRENNVFPYAFWKEKENLVVRWKHLNQGTFVTSRYEFTDNGITEEKIGL